MFTPLFVPFTGMIKLTNKLLLFQANTPLLRSATMVTHFTQRSMHHFGLDFLKASIGPVIHQLIDRQTSFETERSHVSEKTSDKELGASVKECVKWCNDMWTSIYNRRDECPQ